MKKISPEQYRQLLDLINEGELGISEFALEKDFMVTDALSVIANLKNPDFDLIFCGGTCLSKAYSLLDRASEDIDIKAIPKNLTTPSKNMIRTSMSRLKDDLESGLNTAGFKSEFITKTAGDGNQIFQFDIGYSSFFQVSPGMRANLKLEVNYSPLQLPEQIKDIGLLFDILSRLNTVQPFPIKCVDLKEALAEKLVAFPRRLALSQSNPKKELDKSLVRHLYDVYQINKKNPEILKHDSKLLSKLVAQVIEKDSLDFLAQHGTFSKDPIAEIFKAMEFANSDPIIKTNYDEFIQVMVYDKNDAPSFQDAISNFHETLKLSTTQHP